MWSMVFISFFIGIFLFQEILQQLDNLVQEINENETNHSSVVVVMMSHGGIDKKGMQTVHQG